MIELKKARKIPEELVGEIADPEKALADLIYYRGRVEQKWDYLAQILSDIYWDEVDVEKVFEHLKEFRGSAGLIKRLNSDKKMSQAFRLFGIKDAPFLRQSQSKTD